MTKLETQPRASARRAYEQGKNARRLQAFGRFALHVKIMTELETQPRASARRAYQQGQQDAVDAFARWLATGLMTCEECGWQGLQVEYEPALADPTDPLACYGIAPYPSCPECGAEKKEKQ